MQFSHDAILPLTTEDLMFFLSVAAIWAIASMTPGPNTLLCIRYCLTSTRKVAITAACGTVTGTFMWGLAGWLGINVLFQTAPFAYLALKIAGGLYLVWLGLKLFLDLRKARGSNAVVLSRRVEIPLGRAYRMGLATNLANPKTALFVASLFAATMPVGAPFLYGVAAITEMMLISSFYYACLIGLMTHPAVAAGYLALLWHFSICVPGKEHITVRTSSRWRSCEEIEYRLPNGRHAWLWRRPRDSFFSVPLL